MGHILLNVIGEATLPVLTPLPDSVLDEGELVTPDGFSYHAVDDFCIC